MPPSVHGRQSHIGTFHTIRLAGNKLFVGKTVYVHNVDSLSSIPNLVSPHLLERQSHVRTHVSIPSQSFTIELHVSPNIIMKISTINLIRKRRKCGGEWLYRACRAILLYIWSVHLYKLAVKMLVLNSPFSNLYCIINYFLEAFTELRFLLS